STGFGINCLGLIDGHVNFMKSLECNQKGGSYETTQGNNQTICGRGRCIAGRLIAAKCDGAASHQDR
ncbi:MAG: hypothetical protein WAX67_05910, partial [Rugosibacter sp.]